MKKNRMYNSKLICAIILNLVVLLMALIFCDMKYEVSDDFVMETILSGAYTGNINPHMMFVNVLWGYVLSLLYHLFPGPSWYVISLITIGFVSFTVVTYLFVQKCNLYIGLVLSCLFVFFFSDDIYILVQFTKTSALAIMSGSLLFVDGIFREKKKREYIIFGFALCLTGTWIRFMSVFIIAPFVFFIIVWKTIEYCKRKDDVVCRAKGILGIGIGGCILCLTIFGCQLVNNLIYQSETQYRQYLEFNSARSDIVDFPNLPYEENEKAYKEIGLSANEYDTFIYWCFGDEEFYNTEYVREMADVIKASRKAVPVSIQSIPHLMDDRNYSSYPIFWACAVIGMLSLLFSKRRVWPILLAVMVGCGMLYYYYYMGRVVYRVEYGVFLGAFLTMGYLFEFNQKEGKRKERAIRIMSIITVAVLAVTKLPLYVPDYSYKTMTPSEYRDYVNNLFFYSGFYDSAKYQRVVNKRDIQPNIIREIEENKENFYFLDFNSTIQTLYLEYNPWKSLPDYYYDNAIYFAGITSAFPDTKEVLRGRGIENSMKSLTDENVYIVDNMYYDVKLEFLREHYYPNARMTLYKEIDGYKIWKFYKE